MAKGGNGMSGTDHGVMRELNRSLVLDVVKQRSPVSRAAIARETSLAKPTVSAIIEDLLEDGLVREIGADVSTSRGGRPAILLEFNARSQFAVGVHILVEHTTLVLADALGQEVERVVVKTSKGSPETALRAIADEVKTLLKGAGIRRKQLMAIGVCVPGLVEMHSGTCLLAPNLGWREVPVRKVLSSALRVPVFVVNNVDAAVVVETLDGVAQGLESVVMLWVGRGIGAAIMSEGRLLHGGFGLTGEIGHCHVPGATTKCNCGKIGCLETLTDGRAIAKAALAAIKEGRETSLSSIPRRTLSGEDVAKAAEAGDEVAIEILGRAGRTLGLAASWLINLFNPEMLVVGGAVAEAGEPLMGPLREAVYEHTLQQSADRVEIRTWTMGRDPGVTGAIRVALQRSETYYRVIFQG
jgi:glucokinase-like ROK family protein